MCRGQQPRAPTPRPRQRRTRYRLPRGRENGCVIAQEFGEKTNIVCFLYLGHLLTAKNSTKLRGCTGLCGHLFSFLTLFDLLSDIHVHHGTSWQTLAVLEMPISV